MLRAGFGNLQAVLAGCSSAGALGIRRRCLFQGMSSAATTLERTKSIVAGQTEVRFDVPEEIYRSKTTQELIRSTVTMKLCSFEVMMKNGERLMNLGRMLLGKSLFRRLMKKTIYGQFVAAEDFKELKPEVEKLQANGVLSIIDYCIEKDVSKREAKGITKASLDESEKVIVDSIDMAAAVKGTKQMTALKVTSISEPNFLVTLNDSIDHSQKFLEKIFHNSWNNVVTKKPAIDELMMKVNTISKQGIEINSEWVNYMKENASRRSDFSNEELFDENISWDRFRAGFTTPEKSKAPTWTKADHEKYRELVHRLKKIADYAATKDVPLMIDAEQTYFQRAIDYVTYAMMKRYNRQFPLIIQTYQGYLKDAKKLAETGLNLMQKWNCHFAAKLVRGAYMEQERQRAKEMNYEDPINDDYEATNEMYNSIIKLFFEKAKESRDGKVWFMCASHNEESVRRLLKLLSEPDAAEVKKRAAFGQLYGMFDHVSFPLAQAGYTVYKYVPFGPVELALPYLARRAQENSAIFRNCANQISMMRQEIARRRKVKSKC